MLIFFFSRRGVLCSLLACGDFTLQHIVSVVMEAGLLAIFLARRPGTFGSCIPAVVHLYVPKSYLFAVRVCCCEEGASCNIHCFFLRLSQHSRDTG